MRKVPSWRRPGTASVKLLIKKKEITYGQKLLALMLVLTISVNWLGVSAAQQPATGHVLRVSTTTMLPDKREQLPKIVDEANKLFTATKGLQWFKVGYDSATGESITVSLWNSQVDLDAFVKSDARKAYMAKASSQWQGEPVIKNYHVSEAKK